MAMIKWLVLSLFVFALIIPSASRASLLIKTKTGMIYWNVLSREDELAFGLPKRESLEVTNVLENPILSSDSKISLLRSSDKIILRVESNGVKKQIDVSNYGDEIVEIEERGEPQTIRISALPEGFSISQKGITAVTGYSISIEAERQELSVETGSGLHYISVFPFDAVANVVKANIINRLDPQGRVTLSEEDVGEISYVIEGERVIKLFNIFSFDVPVITKVSASTGQVLKVDQPIWLSFFGFILV